MMNEDTDKLLKNDEASNSTNLNNLYILARRAKSEGDSNKAVKYYEQILLEAPNSWEAVFYSTYISARQNWHKNKKSTAVNLMRNCTENVFDLIGMIQNTNKKEEAYKEICEVISNFIDEMRNTINREWDIDFKENERLIGAPDFACTKHLKLIKEKCNSNRDLVSGLRYTFNNRKDELQKIIASHRFDEYWAAHKLERVELETEKESLKERISVINQEIAKIPEKTDGYTHMLELQKEVETLISEKKSLGIFKFKERKAVKEKIRTVNTEIAQIQSRIDSAIDVEKKCISQLESRINNIDDELTKPR